MKKLEYINILRGLAVLAVILVHSGQNFKSFEYSNIVSQLIKDGKYGVQLFFIASAFTIFYSYNSRAAKEVNSTRNFFIRRFFRIAPLYYLAVFYYLWQNGTSPSYWSGEQPVGLKAILLNVFFLNNFDPHSFNCVVPGGWSIGVEMMFYCLVPFLFAKIKNINQALYFLSLTLLFSAACKKIVPHFYHIPEANLWKDYLVMYLPSQLPVFAMGICYYQFVTGEKKVKLLSILVTITVFALFILTRGNLHNRHLFYSLGFLVFAYGLSKTTLTNLLCKSLSYIGTISFSMYLVHFAVLHLLKQTNLIKLFGMPATLELPIGYLFTIFLTAVVSVFTYKFIEMPGQNIGRRLIKRIEKSKAAVTPAGYSVVAENE